MLFLLLRIFLLAIYSSAVSPRSVVSWPYVRLVVQWQRLYARLVETGMQWAVSGNCMLGGRCIG